MAIFNQQEQTIHGAQSNTETITNNFGHISDHTDFLAELKKLKELVRKSVDNGDISQTYAEEVNENLDETLTQVNKTNPEKGKIIQYLTKAKELTSNVTSLAMAIGAAITAVGSIF